jgi:hypothetical protein
MAIWVLKDGQREGPYEEGDIRELIYEGTYGDADPAISDGQYDWTTLGQILDRETSTPEATDDEPPSLEIPPEPEGELAVPEPEPPPIPAAAPEPVAAPGPPQPAPVTVVDFQMPFDSMVFFILKWMVATIIALVILGVIAGIFWGVCLALIAALLHR